MLQVQNLKVPKVIKEQLCESMNKFLDSIPNIKWPDFSCNIKDTKYQYGEKKSLIFECDCENKHSIEIMERNNRNSTHSSDKIIVISHVRINNKKYYDHTWDDKWCVHLTSIIETEDEENT